MVVIGTPLDVRTDSTGHFAFDRVRAGRATVRVDHERLRLFRVPARFDLEVREGETTRLALEVPTGEAAYAAVCPRAASVEGRGALVGRVVDADLGHAVSNAAVLATWRGRIIPTIVRTGAERAESDEFGHLTICDLSSAVRVRLTVSASGYRQRQMNLMVPASGVVERSIELEACRPSDDARVCP